jgi:hypothetical protein
MKNLETHKHEVKCNNKVSSNVQVYDNEKDNFYTVVIFKSFVYFFHQIINEKNVLSFIWCINNIIKLNVIQNLK